MEINEIILKKINQVLRNLLLWRHSDGRRNDVRHGVNFPYLAKKKFDAGFKM